MDANDRCTDQFVRSRLAMISGAGLGGLLIYIARRRRGIPFPGTGLVLYHARLDVCVVISRQLPDSTKTAAQSRVKPLLTGFQACFILPPHDGCPGGG